MEIVKLRDQKHMAGEAAAWFHSKWGIPKEAYEESMAECLLNKGAVPQWYLVMENDVIIGGAGIIENDFHDRKDLSPNLCALYVEEAFRGHGIAGSLLSFICADMKALGIPTLYLITGHTSFYERYGWEFLCMVQGDGDEEMSRMYVHEE